MKKYLGIILSSIFTLSMIIILEVFFEYNFLNFILGMISGIFASILPVIIDNCNN